MINKINLAEVSKRIDLSNELAIVLLDRLGMEASYGQMECSRNIYLVDTDGNILWQLFSEFDADGGPFTNITNDDGEVKAYRWDGGLYRINVKNGRAEPISLMR